jgi:hypothetical protein
MAIVSETPKSNARVALVLAAVALVFFLGIILKYALK